MKKVFIIIVTYKGKSWYDKCFTSLRESTIPVQTVVVDNTPGEEDAEYIREHYPEVHIIKTEENLGFGKANNLGIRYAMDKGCDYVFLLNQDTWLVKPETIELLVEAAEANREYGIISPMHLTADKTKVNAMYEYSNHLFSQHLLNDLYCGNPIQNIYETDYVNAAAWLLPRKTLETVGGFDPIFKHYEEDDNYLLRTRYHKLKIGICPAAQIIHDHKDNPLSDDNNAIRKQQYLLVKWTNINEEFSIMSYLCHYIEKYVRYCLRGKFAKAKSGRMKISYLLRMAKKVGKSRLEDSKVQPSWINNE